MIRQITVLATIVAILFPQASGLLASLGLSRGTQVVICTGEGLRVISLDGSDADLDGTNDPLHCALVHALGAAASPPDMGLRGSGWRMVGWTEPGRLDVGEADAEFDARAPPPTMI